MISLRHLTRWGNIDHLKPILILILFDIIINNKAKTDPLSGSKLKYYRIAALL